MWWSGQGRPLRPEVTFEQGPQEEGANRSGREESPVASEMGMNLGCSKNPKRLSGG